MTHTRWCLNTSLLIKTRIHNTLQDTFLQKANCLFQFFFCLFSNSVLFPPICLLSDFTALPGNQLSTYATLWVIFLPPCTLLTDGLFWFQHFKQTYGLQPILNNFQLELLAEVFEPENLMIKPCDLNLLQLPGSRSNVIFLDLLAFLAEPLVIYS